MKATKRRLAAVGIVLAVAYHLTASRRNGNDDATAVETTVASDE